MPIAAQQAGDEPVNAAKIAQAPEYKKFLEDQFGDPNSFEDAAKAPAFVNEQLNDMKKTMATN